MAENPVPDSKVMDTQEDFENQSQNNSIEDSDAQRNLNWNRKRTGDAYQQRDLNALSRSQDEFDLTMSQARQQLAAVNSITTQHLQNAVVQTHKITSDAADAVVSTRAQILKHADVAADALWSDQLNPVTRGAGNDLTGQAPVNAALGSTASLYAVFGTITTGITTLAQSIAQSNVAITNTNAAMVALLAQLVANSKQSPTTGA